MEQSKKDAISNKNTNAIDIENLDEMKFQRIKKCGKYGFSDESGNLVIPCQWEDASWFYEGLAWVQNENGRCGYIDKTGKVVIPCQWVNAGDFHDGLAYVNEYYHQFGFIDKTGRVGNYSAP